MNIAVVVSSNYMMPSSRHLPELTSAKESQVKRLRSTIIVLALSDYNCFDLSVNVSLIVEWCHFIHEKILPLTESSHIEYAKKHT